jgi:hypothetical protein
VADFDLSYGNMRSSGSRGQAMVFPDALSARGRLTRRKTSGVPAWVRTQLSLAQDLKVAQTPSESTARTACPFSFDATLATRMIQTPLLYLFLFQSCSDYLDNR